MCPRTGRPPKTGITRTKKITIRVTEDDLLKIGRCAEHLNKSRTDAIMYGIHLVEAELKQK